ncbi:DNA translocase FtsK [uncultured Clostridium sp.]|uniref:FtsK/SpoIIIE family DNA translocase n=1 Tax=uncultured Clostridium sp. TaxID=59620 RepID=UPI0025D30C50|nr:DNA translocase FtsK [uncultured Clostridium sp.]
MSKKKVQSKNSKKKKQQQKKTNSDILGITLIAVGIFLLVTYINTSFTGFLGRVSMNITRSLFGLGIFVLPFLLSIIGYTYIKSKGRVVFTKRFIGLMMFSATTLLLFADISYESFYRAGGIRAFISTTSFFHGGMIAYTLMTPIRSFIGEVGSYILLILLYFISYLVMFDTSIKEVLGYIISKKPERSEKWVEEEKEIVKDKEVKNNNNSIDKTDRIKIKNFEESKGEESSKGSKDSEESAEDITVELETKINNYLEEEYKLPDTNFLKENAAVKMNKHDKKELLDSAAKLEETLKSFGVNAKVIEVSKGPSVTRYELQPSAGVKVSKIINLSDDIALNLAAKGVRIEAPIPGKSAVGIEIPNQVTSAVFLREVLDSDVFKNSKSKLAFALGKDISGNCVVADLTKMPHLLIAGATGSGKSVCINTLIISILYKYSPNDVKLLMVDPKVVELNIYNGIPHLLIPVVTNPKKAAGALNWAVNEMTKRYNIFAETGVRNIEGYNELYQKGKVENKMQWIVIIIDELADLMMVCPGDVEDYIARLAQMARAAGMHLVIATQRPSVDVITGVIKANIPSRISFAVSSQIDSRTILDSSGAEKLLGKGDMLYYPVGESKPIRVQGAFITEEEVEKVVGYIKSQGESVDYKEEIIEAINCAHTKGTSSDSSEDDELLGEAIKIVMEEGQASASMLQRRMRVGYNRAARMIDSMEEKGIISGKDGSKPRTVLKRGTEEQ